MSIIIIIPVLTPLLHWLDNNIVVSCLLFSIQTYIIQRTIHMTIKNKNIYLHIWTAHTSLKFFVKTKILWIKIKCSAGNTSGLQVSATSTNKWPDRRIKTAQSLPNPTSKADPPSEGGPCFPPTKTAPDLRHLPQQEYCGGALSRIKK